MNKRDDLLRQFSKINNKFEQINNFFSKVEINYRQLTVLIFLSLLSSLFDAFSIGLLIPVLKGVIEGSIDKNQIFISRELIIFLKESGVFSGNQLLFVLTGLTFIAAVTHQILEYTARIKTCNISRNSTHKLRQLILGKYLTFGKAFFDHNNYSYLQTLLLDFPEKIFNIFILLRKYLTFFFVQIFYCTLLFLISWKMTIFLFIAFIVLHMGILKIYERVQKASNQAIPAIKQINQKVYNLLTCMPLIKVYHQEQFEYQKFSEQSKSIANIETFMDKKSLLVQPLQRIFMLSLLILLSVYISTFIVNKKISISEVLIYLYLIREISVNMEIFNRFKSNFAKVTGHINAVQWIFTKNEPYIINDRGQQFKHLSHCIDFRNLTFAYETGRPILRNVNLSIKKNKMTAIVGASGSGKTTLIQLLLCFYPVPDNCIFFDNTDINCLNISSLMDHMAYVSQSSLLFHDTLRNNIEYGLTGSVSDDLLQLVISKAKLLQLVKNLPNGLNTVVGDQGVKLSGGEKQRVSIARAMLKQAEILILDEATSSLDSENEKLIQEAIQEVIIGRTTIVIAHRLSTIQAADIIYVMDRGRIIEKGSLKELIENKEVFYSFWKAQKFKI